MKLSPLISNGAVFQRGKPLMIAGAGAGKVTVEFLGATRTFTVPDGKWSVGAGTYPAGGPYELAVTLGEGLTAKRSVFTDVYVGDVYVVAGQSNVQFKIKESDARGDELVVDPLCRTFNVQRPESGDEIPGKWIDCREETYPHWSAVSYFMAVEKRRASPDVAVAAVVCCQGASTIQSWLPEGSLTGDAYIPFGERHLDSTHELFGAWNGDGYLWDFMFDTITPYSCRALVWYQGESNTSPAEAKVYDRMLERFAYDWRGALGDTRLPFVIVEIHSFSDGAAGWRELQNAELRAGETIPYAAIAVNEDLGENDLIHPVNKRPIAARICEALETLNA